MQFRRHLYVSDSLEGKEKKIIQRIRHGKYPLNVYLLTVPENPERQLEFYDSLMLMQPLFRKEEKCLVVGLAAGYDEAVQLTIKIVEETLEKNGDVNIRKYLLESGRK